jgi:hypothetical protein
LKRFVKSIVEEHLEVEELLRQKYVANRHAKNICIEGISMYYTQSNLASERYGPGVWLHQGIILLSTLGISHFAGRHPVYVN